MSDRVKIVEGDTIEIKGVRLEIVACDYEHGLYELRDLDVTHMDGHPAVVLTANQLQEHLPS